MDAKRFREEFEKQTKQFETAMKQLEELGNVGIAIPDEMLRTLDTACEARATTSKPIVGIRI
jgi:hypothetical protein